MNEVGPAGCEQELDAYATCQDDGDTVCANDCGGEEDDLANCMGAHCAANFNDPDCQALAASFLGN